MREIVDDLRARGPRSGELERAKAYTVGQRLLAFDETRAVAIHAALQDVVFGQDVDPDAYLRTLDDLTIDDIAAVARSVSDEPAVACVGPHTPADFVAPAGSPELVREPAG
jgi:predicted Zn-dependent peptidase